MREDLWGERGGERERAVVIVRERGLMGREGGGDIATETREVQCHEVCAVTHAWKDRSRQSSLSSLLSAC